jgi:hypothetical protein
MAKYKISGWIYLIFGLIISVYSRIVMQTTDKNLGFFFYVGLFLLVIGVFKIVFKLITNPKDKSFKDYSSERTEKYKTNQRNKSFNIINCPDCNTKNYSNYNYCHSCGFKLK